MPVCGGISFDQRGLAQQVVCTSYLNHKTRREGTGPALEF